MSKSIFKKLAAPAVIATLALALAGCSNNAAADNKAENSGDSNGELTAITVAASPVPHAKILKYLQESGAATEAGIRIDVKEFTDYVQPNEALRGGDVDANYFQTVPYLESESASRGYKFEAGKGVHLEPLGVFSEKIKSLDELKDGDLIGVINDPSNQGRALKVLATKGLINLDGIEDPTVLKVKNTQGANPRGFQFQEVEGPALVRSLPDVAIAVVNGNYAQAGGLTPDQALALESPENNPAVNVLVWRAGEQTEAIKKLDELLHSDVTKAFIEKTWPDKSVIPAF